MRIFLLPTHLRSPMATQIFPEKMSYPKHPSIMDPISPANRQPLDQVHLLQLFQPEDLVHVVYSLSRMGQPMLYITKYMYLMIMASKKMFKGLTSRIMIWNIIPYITGIDIVIDHSLKTIFDLFNSRVNKEYPRQTADVTTIPWMPTLVHRNGIFLGRAEQAEDSRVYRELGLTHVLSIGR